MNSFCASMLENKRAWFVYIALMFLYASSYFQRSAIPGTIFNELSAEYGFSALQIAGMGTAFVWIYSLSQLAVGIFTDKYSGLRVVTAGGILFCIGAMLFPLSGGSLWAMYLMRTLTGLGASTMYLSLVKETDRLFGRSNYAVLIGVVYFVGYSGGLFATVPFERLSAYYGWKNVLIWAGIISILLYVLVQTGKRFIPAAPIVKTRFSFRPILQFFSNRYIWILLFCSTVNFAIFFIIQTVFGKKFLEDFAGMDSKSAALVIFCLILVCMTTLLTGGIFIRINHNRRRPQIIIAVITAFLNTLMMFFAVRYRWPAGFFVAGYLIYAFASGFSAAFTMLCQEFNSRDVMAQVTGCLNMTNYLAIAVFSLLVGKLLDSFTDGEKIIGKATIYPPEAYQALFGILLIPTLISLVLVFFIPETGGHYLRRLAK